MNKVICILIPCLMGFIAMLFCLHFYTEYENNLYKDDPDFLLISPFDFGFFGIIYTILLLIAVTFHGFITLPFWHKFKKVKKMFFLKLLGIIFIACAGVGICFSFYHYYGFGAPSAYDYARTASLVAALCISYWLVNFSTLMVIENKIVSKIKSTAA